MRPTTRLRKMLERYEEEPIVAVGAQNPLYARIAVAAGFNVVYMPGSCVSMEKIGWADVNLITATEVIERARRITSVIDVPLIADADNGYGNAINVMRTVREFIRAGVAGIHIEDQVLPKRCGHLRGKLLISKEEMVGKIKAAKKVIAEEDPDFVLIARTDARTAVGGGMDEVIERLRAYVRAGADVVFPDALLSKEEVERVVREVGAPVLYNVLGLSPRLSIEECKEIGIAIVIYPFASFLPAITAVWDFLHELKEKGTQAFVELEEALREHPLGNLRVIFNFTGYREIQEYEREFLPPEEVRLRYEKSIGL